MYDLVEFYHLKYFLAVAQEGNFTRASERLHVAQPSLSTQIKQGRYLLDSGRPSRLWFRCCLRIGMKNLIQGYGIDCHGLLREPKKELATAL